MGLIEGIGDEVLHFFIALTLALVVTIAWATTDIRNQWNMRVVYLLDRGGRIRASHTLTNHLESATISEGTDPGEVAGNETSPSPAVEDVSSATSEEPPERSAESSAEDDDDETEVDSAVVREEEVDEQINQIVEAMDATEPEPTEAVSRLSFLENIGVYHRTNRGSVTAPVQNVAQPEEAVAPPIVQPAPAPPPPQQQEQDITIKLKYINDNLKIVNGRLGEMLGDFKRRHFENELSSNKLVRLIFNGHVLQRDSDTLQSYGMFDNCVVHCLVYQQRTVRRNVGGGRNGDRSAQDDSLNGNNNNNNQREWDLGNLFIATVSFSLGTAWFFRYQYPQLFTVTATVGLVTITGVFTVLSISSYFPDQLPPLHDPVRH